MSGIGDQGMMPEHVQPQHPDDDTVDESVADPDAAAEAGTDAGADKAQQAEVDEVLTGISADERADTARMARATGSHAADAEAGDTRSQRNP